MWLLCRKGVYFSLPWPKTNHANIFLTTGKKRRGKERKGKKKKKRNKKRGKVRVQ